MAKDRSEWLPAWAVPAKDASGHRIVALKYGEAAEEQHAVGHKDCCIFGRDGGGADIVIRHPRAAEHHAAITQDSKGKTYIIDLGSELGTWLGKNNKLKPYFPYEWELLGKQKVRFGPREQVVDVASLRPPEQAATPQPCARVTQGVKRTREVHDATKSAHIGNLSGDFHEIVGRSEVSKDSHACNGVKTSAYNGRISNFSSKEDNAMTSCSLESDQKKHCSAKDGLPAQLGRQLVASSGSESSAVEVNHMQEKLTRCQAEESTRSQTLSQPEEHQPIGPRLPNNGCSGIGQSAIRNNVGVNLPPARQHGPELPPGFKERQTGAHRFERPRVVASSPQIARLGERENGTACSSQSSAPSAKAIKVKCDKCDKPHPTDQCPYFKGGRDNHKDAWVNYGRKHPLEMGTSGGNFVLRRAKLIRQPGDGSCLFHSICHGLKHIGVNGYENSAQALRKQLANYVVKNASLEIAGDTIEEWVKWDSNSTVMSYARRMMLAEWGGGIEMAACARLKGINIHVYQVKGGQYHRISCFDAPKPGSTRTIHVLYQGGMHYDALIPC